MLTPRSPGFVWCLLVAATLLSYASWAEAALAPTWAGRFVLVIAFLKARLIGIRFMELDEAVWPLRLAFEAWILLMCGILLVMFGPEP